MPSTQLLNTLSDTKIQYGQGMFTMYNLILTATLALLQDDDLYEDLAV